MPAKRGTISDLKKDEWFSDMDWDALSYHFITPSYRPPHVDINPNKVMKGTMDKIMLKAEAQYKISPGNKMPPKGWDAEF